MKMRKHIKRFNESEENLNITDVSDSVTKEERVLKNQTEINILEEMLK
jgi:hypothetical protein